MVPGHRGQHFVSPHSYGLDDDAVEELRHELISAKRLAADVDGERLVWAPGKLPSGNEPSSLSRQPLPQLRDSAPAPPLGASPPHPAVARDLPGAERRQLTVMFCDLADSTRLSARLDPEDMGDVIRSYQELVSEAVRRFDGFIAKFMGDGVLLYFGYPHAQGNDAESAVHSGLAIIEAMPALNRQVGRNKGIPLAVRIGIATGLVVVGETIGEGSAREQSVVGDTPNLAARLQGFAGPNSILISAATHNIVGDVFACEELGAHALKGISERVEVWRVTGLREAEDIEFDTAAGDFPLVGRDEEIGLLRRAWQQTKEERHGRVVFISGEPGIGKSSLVDTLRRAAREEGLTCITFRCSPYHTNSALHPVIEHFRRIAGWQAEDDSMARFAKLERLLSGYKSYSRELLPLFASLMSVPLPENSGYAALDLTPEQLKERTEDALVALALEEAERQPVLEVFEDVHWADPSTLEVLGQLIDQAPTASLLIVLTYRPEFVPRWPARSHVMALTLNRLERPQIEVLANRLGGRPLPTEVIEHIVQKTDGVPLFVEEMTKAVLGSNVLRAEGDRYALTGPLSDISIPASLHESLMARLDRLPTVREVAQLGAVLGREFAYEMLRSIAAIDEPRLRDGLGRLVEAELLYQRGRPPSSRYIFKHALIQDAAYQSLLRRTRQQYHRQVAELIESGFADTVKTSPELVAHHYTEAGMPAPAVKYWLSAGERAMQRSASQEAIGHLTIGLAQLAQLPETPQRAKQELALQRLLGQASFATRGYASPEATRAFSRARELCAEIGDDATILPVLAGVWLFELSGGQHPNAEITAKEILRRAKPREDAGTLVAGNGAVGICGVHLAKFEDARMHFEKAIAGYRASDEAEGKRLAYEYGVDLGAASCAYAA